MARERGGHVVRAPVVYRNRGLVPTALVGLTFGLWLGYYAIKAAATSSGGAQVEACVYTVVVFTVWGWGVRACLTMRVAVRPGGFEVRNVYRRYLVDWEEVDRFELVRASAGYPVVGARLRDGRLVRCTALSGGLATSWGSAPTFLAQMDELLAEVRAGRDPYDALGASAREARHGATR